MFSVTQILIPWSDFSKVPQHTLDEAIRRGLAVHRSCAAYASNLWSPPLEEQHQGYFESFKKWFGSTVEEVIAVEPELVHPVYQYVGHPDLIARLKGDKCFTLVDYKTPAAQQKSWKVQLAAYVELGSQTEYKPERTIALRLNKEGKMPIINEYTGTLAADFSIFLACLQAYKFFKGE